VKSLQRDDDALGPSELEYSFVGGLGSRIYHSHLQLISGTVPTREGELSMIDYYVCDRRGQYGCDFTRNERIFEKREGN
jgi:hypothetical protein